MADQPIDNGDNDDSDNDDKGPSKGVPIPTGAISDPEIGLLSILHGQETPDCSGPTFQDYVMLWGYLYKDPCDCHNKDTWRLYLSLEFKEYIEFHEGTSVFAKQIDLFNDNQPLAGSLVWISRSATVRRVREERAEDEANFLQGAIAKGFFGSSGPSTLTGFTAFARGPLDPGSGGGCGSGSPAPLCAI